MADIKTSTRSVPKLLYKNAVALLFFIGIRKVKDFEKN
ncbi:hypothetical protein GARC_5345 [Paraglaciecola arctica BSs20135]|uniref:Uncharacterized protein n=1 Tax=Paraglaciecola arctica BSs20135 TaxID=493475 RepID=K6ZFU5_9ALTE|nr:hypothetical protein GARC_5345 [Paraglaciecola arctica BSs20135]